MLVVLGAGLGLRLWGVAQGLPYIYNNDENADFLGRAVHMFGGSLNPHYFTNPPAFTYWLHVVFAVWFGSGTPHAFATDPSSVFIVARVSVAVLGTGAVWLLYLTGSRLFGRGVGLLAAALESVAFLPVFYAHFALNDAPLLLPATLALIGSAGVLRDGRKRDYLLAGAGLGLACATKYNGAIMLLPLIAATLARRHQDPARSIGGGVLIMGAGAAGLFVLADPYAVLAFSELRYGITHQATASSVPKLGAPGGNGILYYLWSLTWGLGWAPALAALAGAVLLWRGDRRRWWMLVPTCVVFLIFMGSYARFFGRYLLPILPLVCLLAAYATSRALAGITRHRPRLGRLAAAVAVAMLCGQGLAYSIHSSLILARPYTAAVARSWMVAHIPPGSRIVIEPVMPADWSTDIPGSLPTRLPGTRWAKYSTLRSVITPTGTLDPAASHVVNIEDYERSLSPALIPYYEQQGACWVLTGSTQSGRAYTDPQAAPHAIAYYRALQQQAQLVYRISPYSHGHAPGVLNFDWSFDYYPLGYQHPGPELRLYRLHGGRCHT